MSDSLGHGKELFDMKKHPNSTSKTFAGVVYPPHFQSKNPYFIYFVDNTEPGTVDRQDYDERRLKYAEQELQHVQAKTTGSWKAVASASSGNAIIPVLPE